MPMPIATVTKGLAQQFTSEKIAEERAIRQEFEEQVTKMEAQARAEFQADLAEKLSSARAKFEAELLTKKGMTQAEVEAQLATMEAAERAKFIESLTAQKTQLQKTYQARVAKTRKGFLTQLGIAIRQAKREQAMRVGEQLAPRLIREYRATQKAMFKEAVSAEAEVFGEEMVVWEQRAIGEFETGFKEWKKGEVTKFAKEIQEWESKERESLETQLATAEAEAKAGFKTQIAIWKKEEAAEKLEPFIETWRKEWQPKSLAERILEWKAPDLPEIHLTLFKIPVKGGEVRLGLDVGKFAEGLAEGTAAAAAGLTASAESLVYSVAGLAGVPTPRPPPTFIGGLISSGVVSIKAGELKPSPQLEELTQKPYAFTYAAATLLGDVLLGYGMGKAAQKLVIEPIAKTRVGTWVGYQFKAHAPKVALRAVYGKRGAEYIVTERARLIGKEMIISPTGQVLAIPTKETKLFKELMAPSATGVRADFPLRVTRGARITPFKTTLAKAIGKGVKKFAAETRGAAQILAPLQTVEKIIRPEIPAAALEFGYLPFAPTLAEALGLGAVAAVKVAAELKAVSVVAPSIKKVERLRPEERVASIVALGEIVEVAPWQVTAPVQAVAQVQEQIVTPVQALKLQLKLRVPLLEEEKEKPKVKKKRKLTLWEKRGALFEYPIRKEKEVPSFIMAGLPRTKVTRRKAQKQPQSMSLSNVIFGKNEGRKKR